MKLINQLYRRPTFTLRAPITNTFVHRNIIVFMKTLKTKIYLHNSITRTKQMPLCIIVMLSLQVMLL